MSRLRWSAAELARALDQPPPTEEQVAVIEAPLRPLLVVAGAGSGKTETMAGRVVWLVANGLVEPDEILGLTFTRKAASELSERLTARLSALRVAGVWTPSQEEGAEVLGGAPTVSTYHAYAGRLVGEHGLRLGYERETRLLTEAAAWQVAHEAVLGHDGPVEDIVKKEGTLTEAVLAMAGEMAEHLVTPQILGEHLGDVIETLSAVPKGHASSRRAFPREITESIAVLRERRAVLPMVERYLRLKRARGAMDFADQMALAARIAAEFPDVGALERARYRAVFLDEFQDTSEAQLVFLRSLFVEPGHPVPVTAVGDPHQSIYGWRGASATTLDRFRDDFVDRDGAATLAHLSTSWRNDTRILDVAAVTATPLSAASRVEVRTLASRAGAGAGLVSAARLETIDDEADFVADWIVARRARPEIRTSAILCRKRSQFEFVIAALEAREIPYEVVGLGGLLVTPEISDLVSTLWVVQDPSRGDHLMRLLTGPLVRLGAADLDGLYAWAQHRQRLVEPRPGARSGPDDEVADADEAPGAAEPATRSERHSDVSLVEALEDLPSPSWVGRWGERVSVLALERLAALASVIRRLRGLTALPLADLVGETERALGLDLEVMSRPEYSPAAARAHLDAFADVAAQFSASADRPTLGGFLDWLVAAMAEERGLDLGWIETSPDAVQVMTVHAAKGLEWDAVAIPGLIEASFPEHAVQPKWVAGQGWTQAEAKDKAWLVGASALPYDLRGDRAGLPRFPWDALADWDTAAEAHERFLLASGEHELREERRLMYVAATRARRALLLTAHVWGTQQAPRRTSRFLTELVESDHLDLHVLGWAPVPEPDEAGEAPKNPRDAEAISIEWPHLPDPERTRDLRQAAAALTAVTTAPSSSDEFPTPQHASGKGPWDEAIDLLLAEREERRRAGSDVVEMPRHLSTSALVELAGDPLAFAESVRRPMPQAPAVAARRGTEFHAWVEQHYAKAAMVDILEMPGSADEAPATADRLPELKANFLASPWADLLPIEIETPLETVIDGIAVRGRVDAVFAEGDDWVIVDWKTGSPPTGEAARLRALQLAAYRVAWARLRQVPLERVRAAFFHAATGETVWPDLPGVEEISRVLAQVPEA